MKKSSVDVLKAALVHLENSAIAPMGPDPEGDDEVAGPRLERAPSRKLELELERRDTATVSFARSHSGEVVLKKNTGS